MSVSPRLQRLKERLFTVDYYTPKNWLFQGETILTDESVRNEPLIVRKAYMYRYMARGLEMEIKEDELIVGIPKPGSPAMGTVMPRYATEEELKEARGYLLDQNSIWGHHPPAWDIILNEGTVGVKKRIEKKMSELLSTDEIDEEKLSLYRAMLISLDALSDYSARFAQAALRESLIHPDPVRRRELYSIYLTCSHVPENPAGNFQEALQSLWFTHSLLAAGAEYLPFGTADRYLYPYYKKDLDSGCDPDYLKDLLGSFLIKCNERILIDPKMAETHTTFGTLSLGVLPEDQIKEAKTGGAFTGAFDQRLLTWREDEDIHSEANYNYGQSTNNWLMNLILGGTGPDGEDVTNDLSYLIIDLVHEMSLLMPTLAVRVSSKSPEDFLYHVARAVRYGQGEPAVYNDDMIIPGLVSAGIPYEEACTYSNDGCWEVLIPGKSYFTYSHVMNIQCIEWVLFRGKSLLNGNMEGVDTGDPAAFATFEEFYGAYMKQVEQKLLYFYRRRCNSMYLTHMIAPDPLMSSLTWDCIEKGKDITEGGNRYSLHMMLITGLANTVDSLATIRKLIYEDRKLSMSTLISALQNDWVGYENLRAEIINRVPKFGCDSDYADELAERVMKDFSDCVEEIGRQNRSELKLICGVGTFENYGALGRGVAASADGRLAREALAPNFSPVPGRDVEGPTAAIRSVTRPNLNRYFGGCPLDLSLITSDFEGESGLDRMVALIRSFCDLGGGIITVTGCNVEDLKDAMVHPEKHRSLRVRMGGLSAYFISMAPEQQMNIIRRFS